MVESRSGLECAVDCDEMTPLEEACFLGHHNMTTTVQGEFVEHLRACLQATGDVINFGAAFAGCDILSKVIAAIVRTCTRLLGIDIKAKVVWVCESDARKRMFLEQQH